MNAQFFYFFILMEMVLILSCHYHKGEDKKDEYSVPTYPYCSHHITQAGVLTLEVEQNQPIWNDYLI